MKIGDMGKKEQAVFLASLLLVGVVFASSLYLYVNPPIHVLEAKIFYTYQKDGVTHVWTYGAGKLKLKGLYEFELDETYRITYRSRNRNTADIIISIEKIS